MAFIYSITASLAVSLISMVGVVTLAFSEKFRNKIIIILVSFSAGAMMGGAFFHLLPESLENNQNVLLIFSFAILGFCLFFVLERFLRWHHCHDLECDTHKHLGNISLVGDAIHNVLDGIIIYSAFAVSPMLGLPVTLTIVFHEVPQEVSDFGVLLYAGFGRSKALLYNFLSALGSVVGVIIGLALFRWVANINLFLLPLAAGVFIYISATDLIPEIHKETDLNKSLVNFLFFVLALIFMLLLKTIG